MHYFSYCDIELAKMTKAEGQYILPGHKQSFCQILALNSFHYTIWHIHELCNFNKHWPWIYTNDPEWSSCHAIGSKAVFMCSMNFNCFSFYVMNYSFQWPWTCPNAPLGQKQFFVWSIIFLCFSIRKMWTPDTLHKQTGGRTDIQTRKFLYTPTPPLSIGRIIICMNLENFWKMHWIVYEIYSGQLNKNLLNSRIW